MSRIEYQTDINAQVEKVLNTIPIQTISSITRNDGLVMNNFSGIAEQPPTPQDDNQGGGLPTIKNQENVPPGGGVTEQPEDDGQEDSSEGAETPGPLT